MGRSHTPSEIPQQNDGQEPAKKRSRRKGGRWTRSGCLTCKRRRKRCDEAKPSCHNCTRLNLRCEGYGSMWAAPLGPTAQMFKTEPGKRSRSRSSFSPALSSGSSASPPAQTLSEAELSPAIVSTPSTEHDEIDKPDDHSSIPTPSTDDQLPLASPNPSRLITHLSNLDTHYLQYHVERGSKLLANLETDENPLRSLLIPRALSSPILMNALCALSAVHFANRARSSWSVSAESEGASYYIGTMRGLRTTLANCQDQGQARIFPDDAILAVSLLCKYEIVRGSVKQWAVHLNALRTLVISRGGLTMLEPETAEFIRGLFIYANSVARITNRRVLEENPSIQDLELDNFDAMSTIPKLDIYIGYTEEIIKTCARIADLPRLISDPVALEAEVNAIDKLFRTWTSTKTTYIIPKGMSPETLARLRLVAECFRDAAYIYLHSTLERATTPATAAVSTSISISKTNAIATLLSRIRSRPIDNNCEFSALTFPLFIAGCEVHAITAADEDKKLILETLTALEVNFGIGNVKRAKEVLGIVWSDCDKGRRHWVDVLEELGWDLILA